MEPNENKESIKGLLDKVEFCKVPGLISFKQCESLYSVDGNKPIV